MAIYRVSQAPGFQEVEPVDMDAFNARRADVYKFDATPLLDARWETLRLRVVDPNAIRPDIWCFMGTLIFEHRASEAFMDCFSHAGDLYPVEIDGRRLFLLDITDAPDCLDHDNCAFDNPADPSSICEFAFIEEHLTGSESLFKVPELPYGPIFTFTELDAEDMEFKTLVERHELKGVVFDQVYQAE